PAAGTPKRRRHWALPVKLAASVALGVFAGYSTYRYLESYPYREATPEAVRALGRSDLPTTLAEADRVIEEDPAKALRRLDAVLDDAEPGPLLDDARFLRLDAAQRLLTTDAKIPHIEAVIQDIDAFVDSAPKHAGAPQALQWKARLLSDADSPQGAYETYERILRDYPGSPDEDIVLHEAAEASM